VKGPCSIPSSAKISLNGDLKCGTFHDREMCISPEEWPKVFFPLTPIFDGVIAVWAYDDSQKKILFGREKKLKEKIIFCITVGKKILFGREKKYFLERKKVEKK